MNPHFQILKVRTVNISTKKHLHTDLFQTLTLLMGRWPKKPSITHRRQEVLIPFLAATAFASPCPCSQAPDITSTCSTFSYYKNSMSPSTHT